MLHHLPYKELHIPPRFYHCIYHNSDRRNIHHHSGWSKYESICRNVNNIFKFSARICGSSYFIINICLSQTVVCFFTHKTMVAFSIIPIISCILCIFAIFLIFLPFKIIHIIYLSTINDF